MTSVLTDPVCLRQTGCALELFRQLLESSKGSNLPHLIQLRQPQHPSWLALTRFLYRSIPHAPFGVVVVVKVPKSQSLNLQTILQNPKSKYETQREKKNTISILSKLIRNSNKPDNSRRSSLLCKIC